MKEKAKQAIKQTSTPDVFRYANVIRDQEYTRDVVDAILFFFCKVI